MTQTVKTCDLCAGEQFEPVSSSDRHGRPLETVVCTKCVLVAHQQIPSEVELSEFYATRYRREYHAEDSPSARRVMHDWNNARRIHRQLTPWLLANLEVLEVGAGVGCTVKFFEQQGHRACGLEP